MNAYKHLRWFLFIFLSLCFYVYSFDPFSDVPDGREKFVTGRRKRDLSLRHDVVTGQPVSILISPDYFVQLTFLRDGRVVFPKRVYAGQPGLLHIEKRDGSPYVYVKASVSLEKQGTNLFFETEEDGRIQTYVIFAEVAHPKLIRPQVIINLAEDLSLPLSSSSIPSPSLSSFDPSSFRMVEESSGEGMGILDLMGRMIDIAMRYDEAKDAERKTGKVIYSEKVVFPYPGSSKIFRDPVDGSHWQVYEVWFFPKYDAILLDVRVENTGTSPQNWNYSLMKWRPGKSSPMLLSSAGASPAKLFNLPSGKMRVWFLLMGNQVDPRSEFFPVFPSQKRRFPIELAK